MNASTASVGRIGLPVAITSIGFAVVQLDVTIVNVALPRIGAALDASVAALQWVVDAYTLSFAVLLLTAGALSDCLGARATYVAGFGIFALASSMCGLAHDAPALIAARALQGAGAALLVPSSLALLNAAFADDAARRARAVGLWTAVGGVSIAAGPIVGGALLEAFGWQSIFLVNVPVCVAAAWLALRAPLSAAPAAATRRFDPAGQLLALIALTALVASIIEASAPATSPALIGAGFAVALIAAAAFCVVEARVAASMLPLHFFRIAAFTSAVLFGVAVNLTYYGIVFVLSLYLQQARGYSTFEAGLAYVPLTATFIVSNVASAAVSARHGPRVPMGAGALIGAMGFALLARLDGSSPYLAMLPAFILIPLGMGLAVPAMTTVMLASVGARFTGTASGTLNAARQIGGAIGVALFGALIGRGSDSIIPGLHAAAHVAAAMLAVAAAIAWIGVRRDAAGQIAACRRTV
jgi:DHA2 family methylenomycin A resistance protein-like MFS transporter